MTELFSSVQLRTLVTIADTGSFTRAAERLYKSQPALSMQIKSLEEQVGIRLLERSGRETRLTEAGGVLVAYARRILEMHDEALAKLSLAETAGSVRIGVLEEAALGPLVHVLTRFGRLCTNIQIQLEVATSWELARKIETHALCLAVANSAFAKDPVELLWQERYVWACAASFELAADQPLPLILDPPECPCAVRDIAVQSLSDLGVRWQTVFSSLSLPAIQAAVRAGLGIALIAESAISPDMRMLNDPTLFPELPAAEIALYRSREAVSDAAECLHSFLLENLRTGAGALQASAVHI